MHNKKLFVTADGLKKIQEELDELKTTKRKEIAERIHEAKELGDLSENAEYIEAKEEQGFVETRILDLEQMLKNTEMISHTTNTSTVQIGSTISVKSPAGTAEYTIVGSSEADPIAHKISNESPMGQAFLGHNVGDTVTVHTPTGDILFEILSVK
jgi:transcription elongation factor GreA